MDHNPLPQKWSAMFTTDTQVMHDLCESSYKLHTKWRGKQAEIGNFQSNSSVSNAGNNLSTCWLHIHLCHMAICQVSTRLSMRHEEFCFRILYGWFFYLLLLLSPLCEPVEEKKETTENVPLPQSSERDIQQEESMKKEMCETQDKMKGLKVGEVSEW